jgi:hypothetical protein
VGVVRRYVWWPGHDAAGSLAPVDVLAGMLAAGAWALPPGCPPLDDDEALVVVPPQWVGGWEGGFRLPPGYQHVWRVRMDRLRPVCEAPRSCPYRPLELPPSATGLGPRRTSRRRFM